MLLRIFQEKKRKKRLFFRFFRGMPFEKVNARGGIRPGAFSLTKGWCAFSMTEKGRAFSLTQEFPDRKQFIEMRH